MTSVFTKWNLAQQPQGVTGENWEKVSFFLYSFFCFFSFFKFFLAFASFL